MEYKELVKHHTQLIKDQNDNKWEVIETSDLEEICESYYQYKLQLLGVVDVADIEETAKFPASTIPEFRTDEWLDSCEQLFGGMSENK